MSGIGLQEGLGMKMLYIHQHFATLDEGGSTRSYYLARALVESGVAVDLITRHNRAVYEILNIDGIRVHYLPVFYDNAQGFVGRVYSFMKFIGLAYYKARQLSRPDWCYAVSTPLTTGIIALLLKYFHHIPYYFEVGDLWPLAPIQMGVIRNPLLKQLLFALEKKIYQEADKIVALSPDIQDAISQVVVQDKIRLIPNLADCAFFQCEPKNPALVKQLGVEDMFVITYFGTIGKANHLEYLLEAARSCQEVSDRIFFLIAGKGAERVRLQQIAQTYQLQNVRFLPHVDKYALRDILNVTDAAYLSFAAKPVLETGSPNKFFDTLAAGKLCIINFRGWIKALVEAHSCGVYVDPNQPNAFYQRILPFIQQHDQLLKYQRNARRVAEEQFSRAKLTQQWILLVTQGRSGPPQ